MEIKQKDDGQKGSFYIEVQDELLAEMTYVWTGKSRIIIDHTMVSDELRGKSAGKKMVEKAVEFARQKEIKIIPLCPFAQSMFSKNLEFHDVLQK